MNKALSSLGLLTKSSPKGTTDKWVKFYKTYLLVWLIVSSIAVAITTVSLFF